MTIVMTKPLDIRSWTAHSCPMPTDQVTPVPSNFVLTSAEVTAVLMALVGNAPMTTDELVERTGIARDALVGGLIGLERLRMVALVSHDDRLNRWTA